MPNSSINTNRVLLALLFFALLWRKVNTPTSFHKENDEEVNFALAERHILFPCKISTVNKPYYSTLHYQDGKISFDAHPELEKEFDFSREAETLRIDLIENLRKQARLFGDNVTQALFDSIPYQSLYRYIADHPTVENKEIWRQTANYFNYLIEIYTYANIAQRAQLGNCHEFSSITLAQIHRYFFEQQLPLPKVGVLDFSSHKNRDYGHVAPVFGLDAKENGKSFKRGRLVKLLKEAHAIIADHWNNKAIILAGDICQADTNVIHSHDLEKEQKNKPYAKAFYNSFCDAIHYKTFSPLPHFANATNQLLFEASTQFLLDVVKIESCEVDEKLLATIRPTP